MSSQSTTKIIWNIFRRNLSNGTKKHFLYIQRLFNIKNLYRDYILKIPDWNVINYLKKISTYPFGVDFGVGGARAPSQHSNHTDWKLIHDYRSNKVKLAYLLLKKVGREGGRRRGQGSSFRFNLTYRRIFDI